MLEGFYVKTVDIRKSFERELISAFLAEHGLKLDNDVEVAFGVFDWRSELQACGCAAKRMLKCFAVAEKHRGKNILGSLLSVLIQNRFAAGYVDLFITTRSTNKELFVNCGMFPLVETDGICLLESIPDGPERFAASLIQDGDNEKTIGAVVMNCNPFTKGHRALLEYASEKCDLLYVFIVEEDCSMFSVFDRIEMVRKGTLDLTNLRVALSGPYMISNTTFPSYFFKEEENVSDLQCKIDLSLFAQRLAPNLGISIRFAGDEPFDPVTRKYNDVMRKKLPEYGINYCEIPRLRSKGEAISASRVRALIKEKGLCSEVLALIPESTAQFLRDIML